MACIPGYTTIRPSDNVTGFDSNYKIVAYDEYGENNKNLNHQWADGKSYIVSTDPYQTVNIETIRREHFCELKTGTYGSTIEYQYVIITSQASI